MTACSRSAGVAAGPGADAAAVDAGDGNSSEAGDDAGIDGASKRHDGGGHDLAAADSSSSSSTPLKFAVFGDGRPPLVNDTSGYPSAVVGGIFALAQQEGAQFVVGTGDYMFASSATAVDAQTALFQQARAAYSAGPVYLALGNHECTGFTASNCPNLDETPNIKAFMSKLAPAGVTTPYYRIDRDTPNGKAKLLFVAANAWSPTQSSWLQTQLADPTAYTFVVRHEPSYDATAPGVTPSDALIDASPVTLVLLGHSHEYKHLDAHHVISGNGGAPLAGGAYGLLMIEQQGDGNVSVTELDEATGTPTDTWKVTPDGQAAP